MPKVPAALLILLGSVALFPSCAEKASPEEINRMCERLLVLRGKVGDDAMQSTCITAATAEGISKRQALCRIAAVNTQEYWNRCRTGEARRQR